MVAGRNTKIATERTWNNYCLSEWVVLVGNPFFYLRFSFWRISVLALDYSQSHYSMAFKNHIKLLSICNVKTIETTEDGCLVIAASL